MTLLTALTEVAATLPAIKTVLYADLEEANFETDFKVAVTNLPMLLIVPFTPVDNPGTSGVLKTTVDLSLFILDKANLSTPEYKAAEIETNVIAPMRLLARRFVHKLNEKKAIIDQEGGGITNARYQPMYSQMDAHLFGVFVTLTVPIMERPDVC